MKALELLNTISIEWCNEYANNAIDLAIKELEELENRSCDNCKYRVLHMYYEREKATIDKCSIRKDLRFNGSCDGLKCNKWENEND